MPINNIDYAETIIYKIQHKENPELIYIGHTTNFDSRKYQHQKASNDKNQSSPFYKRIQDNGGWNNWVMIEIEKFPCNDGNEARSRERYWCETLCATLNDRTPYKIIIDTPTKTYNSYTPCKYVYPDYYKHCKKYKFEDILIQNNEYFEKIKKSVK